MVRRVHVPEEWGNYRDSSFGGIPTGMPDERKKLRGNKKAPKKKDPKPYHRQSLKRFSDSDLNGE